MKTIISIKSIAILLSICILFQNCYSYKPLENDKIELSKKYKIQLKNNKTIKGRINNFSTDSISITSKGKVVKVSKENIEEIKKRKFFYLKLGLTITAVMTVSLLAIFGISFNILKKDFNPFKNII